VLFVVLGSLLRDIGGGAFIRAALFFLAGLWAMLGTPYLLDRLGHSEAEESRTAAPRHAAHS
jgi:hypothetical protein